MVKLGPMSAVFRVFAALAFALVAYPACAAGNTLIADSYNHRVIEVDGGGAIVWQYGTTGAGGGGQGQLSRPFDAERLANGNTLVADQTNQRVIELDPCNNIVWQYGTTFSAGRGDNQLNYPSRAVRLGNGNTLIADSNNHRIVEVTPAGVIAWQYGTTGQAGGGANHLSTPSGASRLASGATLIVDSGNNRVIEVAANGSIAWQYGTTGTAGYGSNQLNRPLSAVRLANGNTLIADKDNARVIEVTQANTIAWQYGTTGVPGNGANQLNTPFDAIRIAGGDTLIADDYGERVLAVSLAGAIVWQYGTTGVAGGGANQLRDPTSVKNLANTVRLPDLLVQNPGDATPIGDGVYNSTAAGQTREQTVQPGTSAVYFITLQNDGNAPDTYTLTGTAGGAGWSVNYFDARSGGANVTSSITAAGGMQLPVCRGAPRELRVEIAAAAGMAAGAEKNVLIRAVSRAAPARRDVVRATARTPAPRANVLITDLYQHRVIEVDASGAIVWQYGTGAPGGAANQLHYPRGAGRLANGNTLIADSMNHRVIEVRPNKSIAWKFDKSSIPGQHHWGNVLDAMRLPNGNTLITANGDYWNRDLHVESFHLLIEVRPNKTIAWQYDRPANTSSRGWMYSPHRAVRLANGNTLVTEWRNHIVYEVTPNKTIVWMYGTDTVSGNSPHQLNYPTMAARRPNGNTLITDSWNARVIEVDPGGSIVWQYAPSGQNALYLPASAVRLRGGNLLVLDEAYRRVDEVDASNTVVWQYRDPATTSSDPRRLEVPVDARSIVEE